jgi:hypothetical protein
MISVPLIALACIFIALGRLQIRHARQAERCGVLRRVWAWGVLLAGFVLMILGVLLWGTNAR